MMAPPDKRSRPSKTAEAALKDPTPIKSESTISPAGDSRRLILARRSWAYRLVRKSPTPAPTYGSSQWMALPEGDPAKVAAVVIAAESWAQDGDELPERLALELKLARAAHKRLEDAEYRQRGQAHWQEWSRRLSGKSFAERRAQQLESAKPRPGDHKGSGAGA